MGKTVPSYRMALEFEIHRWKDFRNALPNEKEKEAFDELMDMCRNNGMAGGAACNPIIFEPMVTSIMFGSREEVAGSRVQAQRRALAKNQH
jgi:hypothetical protein